MILGPIVWTIKTGCVCGPNFTSDVIGESPIFSAVRGVCPLEPFHLSQMGLQGRSTLIGHQRKSVHFWELPGSLLFNYWDYWVHFLCISMYRYLLYMYVYIFICTEWNRERQSRVCGKCHTVTESGVMVFVYQSLLTRDVPNQLEVRSFARLFVPNLDLHSD